MWYERMRQKGKKKEWKSKLTVDGGRRERIKRRDGEKENRGLIVGQP
jgi:hypothetical protein